MEVLCCAINMLYTRVFVVLTSTGRERMMPAKILHQLSLTVKVSPLNHGNLRINYGTNISDPILQ